MMPLTEKQIAELKTLVLDAAAKADQVERLNRNAEGISNVFNYLSILPRKALAGTAVGSITLGVIALTSLPLITKFIISPFFCLGTGSLAVMVVPASLEDKKRKEFQELQQHYREAKSRGQYELLQAIENQQVIIIKMNVIGQSNFLADSSKKYISGK